MTSLADMLMCIGFLCIFVKFFKLTKMDFNFDFDSVNKIQRYIKPKIKEVKDKFVIYDNAKKLAAEIDFKANERVFAFVSGNFVFGDFIEAFIINGNFKIKELYISTLSFSETNIDGLKTLFELGYYKKLNIIVSDFFANENNSPFLYAYKILDIEGLDLQISVCRAHTKTVFFETEKGGKVVISGSANLRSSGNIEQFFIEHNSEIYDFNKMFYDNIIKQYKTINKSVRYKNLDFYNDKEKISKTDYKF